jgi:EmrB/QacA subfamily drug resistance transporter
VNELEVEDKISSRSWWTLALTSVTVFTVSLETTIIALAFPEIGRAFPDSSPATLSWVFTAYSIGVASLLLISGWLADAHGRRKMFLLGLGVFAFGSTGSGLAQSTEMLLTFRAVQSVGGAMLYPASLALLLPAFPIQRRQMAIGIWGASGGLASALGPSLGGLFVDGFGWRSVFLLNVPVVVWCLVMTPRKIEESKSDDAHAGVDIIGTPMAAIGVGALVLAIVQGREWGWTDPKILFSLSLAIVLVSAFVRRSLRHPAPLFDLKLFKIRSFAVGNIGALFFVAAFFGWLVFMATFVQTVWGWSVLKTGFAIAPGPALSTVLSPVFGRLADRIGNKSLLLVGATTGAMGMLWLVFTTGTEPNYVWVILPSSFFIGISAGTSFAMLIGATMRDVPPAQFATAGAMRTTVFNLALSIGVALAIALIGSPASPAEALDRYRLSWGVSAGLFVAMGFTFLAAFENRTSAQTAATSSQ